MASVETDDEARAGCKAMKSLKNVSDGLLEPDADSDAKDEADHTTAYRAGRHADQHTSTVRTSPRLVQQSFHCPPRTFFAMLLG